MWISLFFILNYAKKAISIINVRQETKFHIFISCCALTGAEVALNRSQNNYYDLFFLHLNAYLNHSARFRIFFSLTLKYKNLSLFKRDSRKMLINSLSTIKVPFWTKYILQKKLFTAHKKPFTLQFLWNPSMCWCVKEFTNKYINSNWSGPFGVTFWCIFRNKDVSFIFPSIVFNLKTYTILPLVKKCISCCLSHQYIYLELFWLVYKQCLICPDFSTDSFEATFSLEKAILGLILNALIPRFLSYKHTVFGFTRH